ncbi:hypothetical protein [Paracoccus shanxieyensis]|uniref:Uncharacterized protein n=1 Tax=Paracoccus shanxieyensis TaxID=2675752 RepID=A0A6L6IRB0_9RHOB|nr:hypothetical protein [Paracoccus shanxieyensis]MTH62683.1 hypothetical protein [Paracoccus shanxieyensis]MTH86233.1 hypothetical protein [Paracoccus shanxieyensis]
MTRLGAYLLIAATLAFLASMTIYALMPVSGNATGGLARPPMSIINGAAPIVLTDLFLRPRSAALLLMMVLTGAALAWHAYCRFQDMRRLRLAETTGRARRSAWRSPVSAGPPTADEVLEWHRGDVSVAENGLVIGGLMAGALCPWLVADRPVAALVMALLMLTGFLGAAVRGVRRGFHVSRSSALGFAAGWATLIAFAVFITLVQKTLGVSLTLSAILGLTIAGFVSVAVQLRLGRNIAYSAAIILGMIGIAAGTVAASPALATMSVLAIAAIVVALVQVTT